MAASAAGLAILTVNLFLVDLLAVSRRGWKYLNFWKFNYNIGETPKRSAS